MDTKGLGVDHATGPAVAGIPEGFVARRAGGPFLEPIGPLYLRRGKGPLAFGLPIEYRHSNSKDVAHGGMLATVADVFLGIGGCELAEAPGFFITISLTTDFLGPARVGSWLQCEPKLLRKTRTMMFVEGLFTADGEPALRASGVFALPRNP